MKHTRFLLCAALAVILLGHPPARAASTPPISFVEPTVVPTPASATDFYRSFSGVAKGDFNGDGHLDFAATFVSHANNVNGGIEVALGNGDGTFGTPTVLAIPNNTSGNEVDGGAILAKDFNGDGRIDLAVATTNSTVLIYLGNGDGTFAAPLSVALPAGSNNLQAGDVNGDGKLDLVALIPSTSQVAVLLGSGSGTFQAPALYAVDIGPYNAADMALADVDRKHGLDIVVAGGVVDCLLNNGDGTFAAKRTTAAGSKTLYSLYVADFDGDGKPDVVAGGEGAVANVFNGGYHGQGFVFLKGVGDGTFLSPSAANDFPVASHNPMRNASENVTPDLNGDGHPDVVFADTFGNMLTIGYGDGKGGFAISNVAASGGSLPNTKIEAATPTSLVFGNFTSQALPDILVSSYSDNDGPGGLSLVRANPAKPGAFLSPSLYSTGDDSYGVGNLDDLSFALGDFGHNGKISLAALGTAPNFHGALTLAGLGDGTFAPTLPYPLGPIESPANDTGGGGGVYGSNYGLASADFNGDGLPDLIYNTSAGYNDSPPPFETLTFGQGNGQFGGGGSLTPSGGYGAVNTAPEIAAFGGPGRLGFADYYNEGGGNQFTPANTHVFVYLYGNTFSQTADLFPGPTFDSHGFAAGDFDGDGKVDMVMHTNTPERLWFYKGNGDGTFQAPVASSPGIANLFSAATADLNGDGHLDLIFGTYGAIIVLLGNGDGTFGQPAYYSVPGGDAQSLALGDFNGDGKIDVAVGGANDAIVFPGLGDGTFGAAQVFATGFHGGTAYVHTADLNGDGRPDLVFSAGGNGGGNVHFTVLLNGQSAPSQPHVLWTNTNGQASLWTVQSDGSYAHHEYGPYPGWTATALATGADGVSHLLWGHAPDGQASVWDVPDLSGALTFHNYGPYAGWAATSLSAGPDGRLHLLWNHTADGLTSLWSLDNGAGTYAYKNYGPFGGWTARGVATGGDNITDLLWDNVNGQLSTWRISGADGSYINHEFGPYPGWTATALSAGPDGRGHVLWDNTNGTASLWSADLSAGTETYANYGPYGGWSARALATGGDGVTHLLWDHAPDGQMSLWAVGAGSAFSFQNYGPFPGWTAVALSAGP